MTTPERHDGNLPMRNENLPEHGRAFTAAVLQRFDRHRRQRRALIAGSCLFAIVAAASLVVLGPVPDARTTIWGLRDILAVLALMALCGVMWIVADTGDKLC
jgi:hypothetical protein